MYLCIQGSIRPQECKSFHIQARRTRPWSRRRSHHGTDTANMGPYDTLPLQRTPSHYGHTWARLRKSTKRWIHLGWRVKQFSYGYKDSCFSVCCLYSQGLANSMLELRSQVRLFKINKHYFSFCFCQWWKSLSGPMAEFRAGGGRLALFRQGKQSRGGWWSQGSIKYWNCIGHCSGSWIQNYVLSQCTNQFFR